MGAAGAKEELLRRDEVDELEQATGFDGDQVLELYSRFRKLDRAGTGTITRGDLLAIPELAMNPLVDRVVSHFGFTEQARINFPDFLRVLSVFLDPSFEEGVSLRASPRQQARRGRPGADESDSDGSEEEPGAAPALTRQQALAAKEEARLRLLFDLFDTDNDGLLSSKELFGVLKSMVGVNMVDEELTEIVARVVRDLGGQDAESRISFAAFQASLGGADVAQEVAIRSWRD
jgi:Ca2+-binding EF-hand superfamily protein